MFNVLGTRPTAQTIDHTQQPQVEEIIEPLRQTSLENRVQVPSSEMPREPPNARANVSGDNSRTVRIRNSENERREGYPGTVSGTGAGGHRGEHWTSGGDSRLRSLFRARTARLRSLESDHRRLADEHELTCHNYRRLYEAHGVTVTNLHETQTTCKNQQQQIKVLREKLRDVSTLLDVRN